MNLEILTPLGKTYSGEVIGVNTLGAGRDTGNVGLNLALGINLVRQFTIEARPGKSSPVATIETE